MRTTLMLALFLFHLSAYGTEVHLGLASNFSEISTSNSNPYGDDFRKGVQLALKHSEPTLSKKKIKVVIHEFDYGTSQTRVAEAVNAAKLSSVLAVMGYNLSPHALLAAPLHQQAKLPMMSSSGTATRLSEIGPYVHLSAFSNEFMGQSMAWLAKTKLYAKKALMIVAEDCAYCHDLANAFEKEFASKNGKIVARIGTLDSQRDFEKVVAEVKGKDFDVLVVPNYELNSVRTVAALSSAGINGPFIGGDGWGETGEEFYKVIGDKEIKGYSVSHWHPNLKTKKSADFMKAFSKAYGKTANDTAVLAYDSMMLLLEAVYNSRSFDRESIEKALNGIKTFTGATGRFRFIAPNRAPQKSVVLLTLSKGKFQVVDHAEPKNVGGRK